MAPSSSVATAKTVESAGENITENSAPDRTTSDTAP